MKLHPDIDRDELVSDTFSLEMLGYCNACGVPGYGLEPDARRFVCEECGQPEVFGAEELLIQTEV